MINFGHIQKIDAAFSRACRGQGIDHAVHPSQEGESAVRETLQAGFQERVLEMVDGGINVVDAIDKQLPGLEIALKRFAQRIGQSVDSTHSLSQDLTF